MSDTGETARLDKGAVSNSLCLQDGRDTIGMAADFMERVPDS